MESFSDAKERLHNIVNDASLTMELKETFHNLIDTFFTDHEEISKNTWKRLKARFEIESAKCILSSSRSDVKRGDFEKVKNQIDNTFLNLLDESVDKKTILEKIININVRDFVFIKRS